MHVRVNFEDVSESEGDDIQVAMLKWLKEASAYQAFSYIRTCMIPFLQIGLNGPSDRQLQRYLTEVLSDFMFWIVSLLSNYDDTFFINLNNKETPDFLNTRTVNYSEIKQLKQTQQHSRIREQNLNPDFFSDVIELFGAMGTGTI
jgi:hypothetical protein